MAAAKLPTAIVVGPYTYTVSSDELARLREEQGAGGRLAGISDHERLTINVDLALAPDIVRDTLLHEVLHTVAAFVGLSYDWGKDKEEDTVRRLSPALLDVLRRNPDLVAYLTEST